MDYFIAAIVVIVSLFVDRIEGVSSAYILRTAIRGGVSKSDPLPGWYKARAINLMGNTLAANHNYLCCSAVLSQTCENSSQSPWTTVFGKYTTISFRWNTENIAFWLFLSMPLNNANDLSLPTVPSSCLRDSISPHETIEERKGRERRRVKSDRF